MARKRTRPPADVERRISVDPMVYPRPEYRFPTVKIGLTYRDSVPDVPAPISAPPGAPNILLVLLDDVGFGWSSAFGGLVRTPTAELLAAHGLRYSQFHTTGLCPATRAALLTGRNHHSTHYGLSSELATGFPGYDGVIPRSCATIAELLHENGYATGWWGKHDNVPEDQVSDAGPFDSWPTRRGVDYFYGFIGGETDQFSPALYRDTRAVPVPGTPEDGYHLSRDLTDDCIGWMRRQKSLAPGRPLFVYFAPAAAHAPHQPPLDWRRRNRNRFDMGWDRYREDTWRRQLETGIIPRGTRLTPRPAEIPAWTSHTLEQRLVLARQAENYADFLEHADHEVGRLLDALDEMDELRDTLVLYIIGDSGSSAEGGLTGAMNILMRRDGVAPTFEHLLARVDDIGLPGTYPDYGAGWAWAGGTPFQWTKPVASHFGGTRNGMIVSWPSRIGDPGRVRMQFHHVIDVVPTILESVGIVEPSMVNGVAQRPIEGISFAYTFTAEHARSPGRRSVQYFELLGSRALYRDGWIACCRHGRLPWDDGDSTDFARDRWELYHVAEDFSESVDLAAKRPEKLRELQDFFMAEAARNNVLPLDDRLTDRSGLTARPRHFDGRNDVIFYPGMVRLPQGSAPRTHNVTHAITVDAEVPHGGAEGVLVCLGRDTGGWSFYIKDGRLVYHYNWFNTERYEVVSDVPVPEGHVVFTLIFLNETPVRGGPATVRLGIDGGLVGEGRITQQVRGGFGAGTLDVGMDTLSPVSTAYAHLRPFAFTGTLRRVRFRFGDVADLLPAGRLEPQTIAAD